MGTLMSRDFAKLEAVLLADLAHRTGRSLDDWMTAIDDAALADRNAVIDWLRPQGFTFANASWLERIHNNGGRPIYVDATGLPPPPPRAASSLPLPQHSATPFLPDMPAAPPRPAIPTHDTPHRRPPPPEPQPQADHDPARLEQLLARGKAFRPLAQMLLDEIQRTLPGVTVATAGDLVVLSRPLLLAALQVSPKGLQLALALDDTVVAPALAPMRLPGAGKGLARGTTLTDARQIGPDLLDLVKGAAQQANPPPPGANGDH